MASNTKDTFKAVVISLRWIAFFTILTLAANKSFLLLSLPSNLAVFAGFVGIILTGVLAIMFVRARIILYSNKMIVKQRSATETKPEKEETKCDPPAKA